MQVLTLTIACCAPVALVAATSAHAHRRGRRSHTAAHGHTPPQGGINISGIDGDPGLSRIDSEVAAARRLHAKLVRVEMPWATFEPDASGHLDGATVLAADRLMKDAGKAEIKVIALVDRTPCWASSAPAELLRTCVAGESIGGAHAWPPREASSYAAFVGWLAKRYGSELAAIEVWNEPDQANQAFFAGPDKPQRYAALLRAAYPAIKQADPRVKVLAGSLVGSNGAFMNALYKEGIAGDYDGVAVHFYTLTLASLRVFRADQLAHDDHTPLWLDEFGWTTCWPRQKTQEEQGCVTQEVQAQNLADTVRELAHTGWVAAETAYELQDTHDEDFGLLSVSDRRKPSFYALSQVLRSPFGSPSPVTLRLRSRHGQVIASGSAPVGDYMKLEAFQNGRLRYHAIFTLDRFDRYSVEFPQVLGTHMTVRVYQYWLGPGRGAQRSL